MTDDLLLSGMKLNSFLEELWSFVEGKSICFLLKILLLIIHLSNVHVSLNNETPLCHQYLLLFHPDNPKWQTGILVLMFCSVFGQPLFLSFVSCIFHFRKTVQDAFKILISRGILIYIFHIFAQAHSIRGKDAVMVSGFNCLRTEKLDTHTSYLILEAHTFAQPTTLHINKTHFHAY